MLLLGDYSDILILNTIVQFLLVIMIIISLQKMGKGYAVLPFCITLASMMPIAIALCMQLCTVYYVMLFGILMLIRKYEKSPHSDMCYVFLVIGMATSYVDFLTYPFVSLGIPLVIWIILDNEEKVIQKLGKMVWNSGFWCAGYVGMWAGKWILGSILSPESGSLSVAIKSITYRGSNKSTDGIITIFDVVMKNAYVYIRKPMLGIVVCMIAYYCYKIVKNRSLTIRNLGSVLPYGIAVFYPLIWYKLAENHSYEHAFMAYRELAIGLFAGLILLASLAKLNEERGETGVN